jgi:hypothetical protein
VIPPIVLAADPADGAGALLQTAVVGALVLLAALPVALLAAARLRAPLPRVARAARRLPLRSFLVGVLAGVAVLLLVAAGTNQPLFRIPAAAACFAAALLAFLGLVAEARSLGCELRGRDPGGDGVEGGSVALGWLVLAGVPLLILAGPVVLLYLALRGTGAAVIGLATGGAEASATTAG